VATTTPEQSLQKTLTWRDGFAIAMVIPNGLLLTVGYAIGALGAWAAIAIWVGGAAIGFLQNKLFAEMAAMFPEKSGGVSRYAAEAWKRYFAPLGAVAAFGYWMGWSLAISVNAASIGLLVQTKWFPDVSWGFTINGHSAGLGTVVAIVAVWAAWALNYFGVRLLARASKTIASIVVLGLVIVVVVPIFRGQIDFGRVTWMSGTSITALIVWFYVTAWTTYGTEICATFAPEYKDTVNDTSKALRYTGLASIALFFIAPLAMAGSLGEAKIAADPVGLFANALTQALGGFADVGVTILVLSMFFGMVSTTADGGRALYGLAREGLTLRQFDHLNAWGTPGRSLTLDALVNSLVLVLLGSPLSILVASNFGYLSAVTLAVAGFLLLRKDRPDWPRPIRLGNGWIPIAAVLTVFNVIVCAIGVTHPGLAGQGTWRESVTGMAILMIAILLYVYRCVVQDKGSIVWRIKTPSTPEEEMELESA
jgi:amino acid transporter